MDKMKTVYAPNKTYTGTSAGVAFANGVGRTDNLVALDWLREKGYQIEGEESDEPEPSNLSPYDALSAKSDEELATIAGYKAVDLPEGASHGDKVVAILIGSGYSGDALKPASVELVNAGDGGKTVVATNLPEQGDSESDAAYLARLNKAQLLQAANLRGLKPPAASTAAQIQQAILGVAGGNTPPQDAAVKVATANPAAQPHTAPDVAPTAPDAVKDAVKDAAG